MTLSQIRDLLLTHKRDLETAIAANEAHEGDRITRTILDGLTRQLRRYLAAVTRDLQRLSPLDEGPFGLGGFWGENGKAPAIKDLIAQSELHRNAWARPVEEMFWEAAE
jgi:hypothetical protein